MSFGGRMDQNQCRRPTSIDAILVLAPAVLALMLSGGIFAAEIDASTPAVASTQEASDDRETQPARNPETLHRPRLSTREARQNSVSQRIVVDRTQLAQSAEPTKTSPAPLAPPAGPATDIKLSFKMDPRLLGPTYGGERWISPPVYMGAAAQDTVEARIEASDASGRPVTVSPKWIPSDPAMVEISPAIGNAVRITVKQPGESSVELASEQFARKLSIRGEKRNEVMHVQIIQTP